jgi:hypothetical protein
VSAVGWMLVATFALPAWQVGGINWVVVSDSVAPRAFLVGERAERRVVIRLPEGVTLEPGALTTTEGVETVGAPRVTRLPDGLGSVEWSLAYPFTAWTEGAAQLGALRLRARQASVTSDTILGSAGFRVIESLPAALASPPPAAPAGPFPPSGLPWRLLPLAPLILVGITGAGWWRARRSALGAGAPTSDSSTAGPSGAQLLRELSGLAALADRNAAAAAVGIAERVRMLPTLRACGVTPSCATTETVARVAARAGPSLADPAGRILAMADGWRYGAVEPSAEEVRGAFVELMETLR